MAFHLIVTCVSQKRAKKVHSILEPAIESGPLSHVFRQWYAMLSNSALKPRVARALYKGSLWNAFLDLWGIVSGRVKEARFWILSAGYGLISAEDTIIPYDITFQDPRNGVPSILAKINEPSGVNPTKTSLQAWWEFLIKSRNKEPISLESLIGNSLSEDYFLIVLSKDYLYATFNDLKKALKGTERPEHIAIISNNVDDPTARQLKPNWLYADTRLVNLPGASNTLVNARIAKALLWHMFQETAGLSWWSLQHFDAYLKELSVGLPTPEKPTRQPTTDAQVEEYIREALSLYEAPFSRLHRAFRDSGRACEHTRFRGIYYKVKEDLRQRALISRPFLPVRYNKRNARMLFFLPDWDDRVDPLFDFENDESTPHRDPYEHDAYHYELYGTLNCDGILVSKSVLEENPQKKEKAMTKGIHGYLRLPRNVPVLGDCGAFNYMAEENPPYETDEILDYYESLGFDYGVSIDHLIVPNILTRRRYFKEQENDWIEIGENEFARLKNEPNSSIRKTRRNSKQRRLFHEKDVIVEETYLSEQEKNRRYELTIENARQFIDEHRKRGCHFMPIGAVQGWDAKSYTYAVREYQNMGYRYIALGGLVRSTTPEIIEILESINAIRRPKTKLHIFGVSRLGVIDTFMRLGVASVDSAGMLRQAWLSTTDNYYTPNGQNYTAIRIPPVEKSGAAKTAIKEGVISERELRVLESKCLASLRGFDCGTVTLHQTLKNVMAYHEILGGDGKLSERYLQTLTDRPWKKCPCKLCRETGVDIIIFRRNNRNRRRGFHNTCVFFNKFRKLTDKKLEYF